jgi:hypothetical protein
LRCLGHRHLLSRTGYCLDTPSEKVWQTLRDHALPDEVPWFVIGVGSGGVFAAFADRCMIVKVGNLTAMMAGSTGGGRITTFPYGRNHRRRVQRAVDITAAGDDPSGPGVRLAQPVLVVMIADFPESSNAVSRGWSCPNSYGVVADTGSPMAGHGSVASSRTPAQISLRRHQMSHRSSRRLRCLEPEMR